MCASLSSLATVTVGAAGLVFAGVLLPTPWDSCASAAPSPTCGSDLRECLHASAQTGIYGSKYVTADDVRRCMDAFNVCLSGSLRNGGSPPPSAGQTGGKGLPQHFAVNYQGVTTADCRVNGDKVHCSDIRRDPLAEGQDSWAGAIDGTLSGMTLTGTKTIKIEGHYGGEPGCFYTHEATGPAAYVFNSDGTLTGREGPLQWQLTDHGSCSGGSSQTSPQTEASLTWSEVR